MKRRILLDVDGVSANFIQRTLDSLVALGGPTLHHDQITTWNMFRSLPQGWAEPLTAEWVKQGWCAGIEPYQGSQDAIRRLRDFGEVVFVTTPMDDAPHWMWERDQWLRRHFDATSKSIIFAAAKYTVVGDMFVDDKASHVAEWVEHHPGKTAVLWDCPTNRNKNEFVPPGVVRTNCWDDLIALASGKTRPA